MEEAESPSHTLPKEFSSKFEVKMVEPNNRGLFTKNHVNAFDTLIEVEPMAIAVLAEFKNKVCNYCLQEK